MEITHLLLAVFLPLLVVAATMSYLRTTLHSVLVALCNREEYADFWIRSATVLALSASWVLTLLFSSWDGHTSLTLVLRQQLLLIAGGIFISAGWIARSVWRSISSHKQEQTLEEILHGMEHTS